MPPVHALLYAPHDREQLENELLPLLANIEFELHVWDEQPPTIAADTRVLVWLDDNCLKAVMPHAINQRWQLALLPHPGLVQARQGFGVANKLEHALEDAAAAVNPTPTDLLYCNQIPVFNSIVIGDTYSLKPARVASDSAFTRLRRMLHLLPNLSELHLNPFKLRTHKQKTIDTAALGIVVVEHGRSSPLARRILEDTSPSDGMLHALVLAPRSIFELLGFLFSSAFFPARNTQKLPPSVGHIKTRELIVNSPKHMPYSLDGINHREQELHLRVEPGVLQLLPGRHMNTDTKNGKEHKEIVKTQALPIGEARTELITYPMPWIHHAAPEEFKELFLMLRENARTSEPYLTLMVLSTLLASVGLFANSAPVIIGAMILAPLMAPIISVAMGLLRQDARLISESIKTLGVGIGMAISCAMLLAWILPLEFITAEIGARLKPTLLDLAVAIISGIAGAYAHARSEIARSLAGVAIAVALVPPLAVTGIGLGWFNFEVFFGALLLFLTNLSGIILAASLTFLYLGYSPFKRAKKGLLVSLVMVAVVSIPLGLGFYQMVREQRIVSRLNNWEIAEVRLQDVRVKLGTPLYIQARLISRAPLEETQLDIIKAAMEARLDQPIQLEVVTAIVLD